MTVDCSDSDRRRVAPHPLIATFAHDDLAARRIECALAADGMSVAMRGWSPTDGPDDELDPEVLVIAFGRGVTERDQQMRRLRRRLPKVHLVAVMPEDSRRSFGLSRKSSWRPRPASSRAPTPHRFGRKFREKVREPLHARVRESRA